MTPNAAGQWDLFDDPQLQNQLIAMSEAAHSDQVLELSLARHFLSVTFRTPSGPIAYNTTIFARKPEGKEASRSPEEDLGVRPIPVSDIDLNAIRRAAEPSFRCAQPQDRRIYIAAVGPGQAHAELLCGGDCHERIWLSDLAPVRLDPFTSEGIAASIDRLSRGSNGQARELVLMWLTDGPWAYLGYGDFEVNLAPVDRRSSPHRLRVFAGNNATYEDSSSLPLARIDPVRLNTCRRQLVGDKEHWSVAVYAHADQIRYQWLITKGDDRLEQITDQDCHPV